MYEPVFRNVLFPAYEALVKRRGTPRHLRDLERSQRFDADDVRALQLERLNRLLAHCWTEVPFLKAYWGDHGLAPGALGAIDDLERYPLIDKRIIADHHADMVAASWRGRTLSKTTGGTTGDPFRFEYTMDSYARRTAAMWRGYEWAGAGLGTRTAYLWGTGQRTEGWGAVKDRLYHGAFNRRFFDAFALRTDTLDSVIEAMAAYRPRAVVGYVAPVALVARRMLATGRTIHGLRGVLTGAEALLAPERADIERAFGCPAFESYGSREFMLMASECERHEGLHVTAEHLVLETVDAAGRAVTGASGRVVVTDLFNYGMPFVRYLNGDAATYSTRRCSCGRGLPLLESVDGRLLDGFTTPDGRVLVGEYFVYAMLDVPGVVQWQVVQTAPDALEFRMVCHDRMGQETTERLRRKVQATAGPAMRVDVVQVESIPTTRSGKRRLTVSLERAALEGVGGIAER